MMSYVKGVSSSVLLFLNVVCVFTLMIPLALLKLLLPLRGVRASCDRALNALAGAWVRFNGVWMALANRTRWRVLGLEGLRRKGWYLIGSNHQSWVDILVLQKIFAGRVPMLKFFIKRELLYVPIMGLAWWALDFPFLRRQGGKHSLAKDMEATRKACEKFRLIPTSVLSFVEGTRFTQSKHDQQHSPYRHLLKPKVGGLAMALETMGERFESLLDVTIIYPRGVPNFWDVLSGKLKEVVVQVRKIQIPAHLRTAPLGSDARYREQMQSWIAQIWAEKDAAMDQALA